MSVSSSPFVINGHTRSQNSSPYPPSSNDGAARPETNGTTQQEQPLVRGGVYAVAGPSSSIANDDYEDAVLAPPHNEHIVEHLYNAGFQMGEYADTLLQAHDHRYQLHAIILSRSPYLAHLISASPKSGGMHNIYVPLENFPEITDQGFAVALGYLYSYVSLKNVSAMNARAVLSAGCLLGGMDDLCSFAYQACRESITTDSINEWVDFVDSLSPNDGSVTPSEVQRPTILGPYAPQLRSDVFNFLVVQLPSMLDVHSSTGNGRDILLGIFSRLGFGLFKSAIESPMFQIGTDQERFRFAKAAIELRKRTRGSGAEETVVLAFGGVHSVSAVHVTRKMKKRALFKVG